MYVLSSQLLLSTYNTYLNYLNDLHMGILLTALERKEHYDYLYEKSVYERVGVHHLTRGTCPLYVQEIKPKNIS